ncbi:hypothetical protein DAEQUDRAFT_815430 [Daedalea quercina L-15889]|uniref:Uncharacterized protein n=1 Tax=Daedalea quercina L-15889 TaxID=1314783 RepID=A0A165KZF5_9APHY|nr:hypothetical protein DAEQUDRAFT_815430 [Daedalea quercina L-15889]
MPDTKPAETKSVDPESEAQTAPESALSAPETQPTQSASDAIDDDDFEEWKPRGPPKSTVSGGKASGVRR